MSKVVEDGVRRASRIAQQLAHAARAVAIRLDAPVSARSVENAKDEVETARYRAEARAALFAADLAEDPASSEWDKNYGSATNS